MIQYAGDEESESGDSFLDDRAVEDLSYSTNNDSDEDEDPVGSDDDPDAAPTKRRRLARGSECSDDDAPAPRAPAATPARPGPWGCVAVFGYATATAVACYVLQRDPGDDAVAVLDEAMQHGYCHPATRRALVLLGLKKARAPRDPAPLAWVHALPMPPLSPVRTFYVNCAARHAVSASDYVAGKLGVDESSEPSDSEETDVFAPEF